MTTRVGIVGTGGIAGVQADSLSRIDDAEIVAVTDIDEGRAREFAAKWGGRVDASLEAMLETGGVDIVHLCSPPGLHVAQGELVLRAGVSALSEKPPALSLAEFDRIRAAEEASSGWFATVSQHRFGGRARWLAERTADGALGDAMTAVCHTLWYRPESYFDMPWRGTWASEGGGPTMGHGIHQIDTMLSILGPWREVTAVAARRARPVETEDLSAALVTLESGAVVSIVNSLLSPRETSYLRFDYTHATVELEHLYGYGDDAWRFTAAPGAPEGLADEWERSATGRGSGHGAQFVETYAALAEGRPLPVTTADARDTLELLAAIYASAFEGRPVAKGEIDAASPFAASMRGSGAPWEEKVTA
ncbi:Gfo/Idh/MocA family protein [Microbacterium karelineae]|uniref:Gfo/Idh/MocA family protein n=1 Tax=Microbacterium karelineae TaxID=2654283 RepID=UPI0012E9AFFF|nr:Gfo/Idh/MocA family oxidoreductase [Microbacterium karelineae]